MWVELSGADTQTWDQRGHLKSLTARLFPSLVSLPVLLRKHRRSQGKGEERGAEDGLFISCFWARLDLFMCTQYWSAQLFLPFSQTDNLNGFIAKRHSKSKIMFMSLRPTVTPGFGLYNKSVLLLVNSGFRCSESFAASNMFQKKRCDGSAKDFCDSLLNPQSWWTKYIYIFIIFCNGH